MTWTSETVPLVGTGRSRDRCNAFAVVDRDVYDSGLLRRGSWRLNDRTCYRPRAYTPNHRVRYRGFPGTLYLERLIANAPIGKFVRFKNGNTLDCRRANLQLVDQRSDVARDDCQQRVAWRYEEMTTGVISPERRRTDAWRLTCEGYTFEAISRDLRCTLRDASRDVLAVLADPLAGVGVAA